MQQPGISTRSSATAIRTASAHIAARQRLREYALRDTGVAPTTAAITSTGAAAAWTLYDPVPSGGGGTVTWARLVMARCQLRDGQRQQGTEAPVGGADELACLLSGFFFCGFDYGTYMGTRCCLRSNAHACGTRRRCGRCMNWVRFIYNELLSP